MHRIGAWTRLRLAFVAGRALRIYGVGARARLRCVLTGSTSLIHRVGSRTRPGHIFGRIRFAGCLIPAMQVNCRTSGGSCRAGIAAVGRTAAEQSVQITGIRVRILVAGQYTPGRSKAAA